MLAALRALKLLRYLPDRRARAAVAALASRSRPPSAAGGIEERRAQVVRSEVPLQANDRTVGEHAAVSSKSPSSGAFLHRLVRSLEPRSAVEMGTAVGISGAYIASALPTGGKLVTLDMLPVAVRTARETFAMLELDDRVEVIEGRFQDTLEQALRHAEPVDFLFIDGHHEEAATVAYLDLAVPHLADQAVVVFDDINFSTGMQRAWATVAARAPGFAVPLGALGLWAN
jgi:predicted O-methyltransferase YrrM